MHLSKPLGLATVFLAHAGIGVADDPVFRNVLYLDSSHTVYNITSLDKFAKVTHVITAFMDPLGFLSPAYNSSLPVPIIKATPKDLHKVFPSSTKMGISIGGWGPYSTNFRNVSGPDKRDEFATNLADWMKTNEYDFVDIDWEYPGGGGDAAPLNATAEIVNFAPFLQSIKSKIGDKTISLAVGGTDDGMAAFRYPSSLSHLDQAWAAVEFVTVMAYDFVNRNSVWTGHHTDVDGSAEAIQKYLAFGLDKTQLNLGFAFYAKHYPTVAGCSEPIYCSIPANSSVPGGDTLTFRDASLQASIDKSNLKNETDGTCGISNGELTNLHCLPGDCCSSSGYCGNTSSYCQSCQTGFGVCQGPDIAASFQKAQKNSVIDDVRGGVYYWDNSTETPLFWTWETPDMMWKKYEDIVLKMGLGGIAAWSVGEDSVALDYIGKMQEMATNHSQSR